MAGMALSLYIFLMAGRSVTFRRFASVKGMEMPLIAFDKWLDISRAGAVVSLTTTREVVVSAMPKRRKDSAI
jgi:hypothetical protein